MVCKCKITAFTRERAVCEHVWRPSRDSSSSGLFYLRGPSLHGDGPLHGRSANSRGTLDGHIREGETAGVKATVWPQVKSGGSSPVGVSESRGCCPTGLSLHVPVYRLFLHESDCNHSNPIGCNWKNHNSYHFKLSLWVRAQIARQSQALRPNTALCVKPEIHRELCW